MIDARIGDDSRGTLVEGVVVNNSTNRGFVPHASHDIAFDHLLADGVTNGVSLMPKSGSQGLDTQPNEAGRAAWTRLSDRGILFRLA